MDGLHRHFGDVVRVYQQPLYWYIRRVVLVHEDAEDILQETFLKAYRHMWQLRSREAVKAWLFRIATNEMNRYFRKRPVIASLDELPGNSLSRFSESQGIDARNASSQVISAALLEMSPLQRQVFCMRYYEEMAYDQIGRITGASKNSLMVSYHEAKKKIEKMIGNE